MEEFNPLGLGRTMEKKLHTVGIHTVEELRETGSRETVFRLKQRYPGTCVVILYHLESALRGIAMKDLGPKVKSELRSYYEKLYQ